MVGNNDTDDSWTTKSSSSSAGSRNSPLEAILEGSSIKPDPIIIQENPSEETREDKVMPAVIDDIFSQAGDSPFMSYDNVSSVGSEQIDNQGDNKRSDYSGFCDMVQSASNELSGMQVTDNGDKVNGDIVSSEMPHTEGESEETEDIDGGIKGHVMSEQEMVDC